MAGTATGTREVKLEESGARKEVWVRSETEVGETGTETG